MHTNDTTATLDLGIWTQHMDNASVQKHMAAMLSLLVDAFNRQASDADKCNLLASYAAGEYIRSIAGLPEDACRREGYMLMEAVWETVYRYGEPEQDIYLGRDDEGEKQYQTLNPDTYWMGRINPVFYRTLREAGVY